MNMPTALPVFSKSQNASEIIDSLLLEGIMCVRISVRAKDSYPKTLKGGFAPEDVNKKSQELSPSDPKAPPFPAMTATMGELNKRIAWIKRRLVRGFSPQSGRTEFFVSSDRFPEIQAEIESVSSWLRDEKIRLEGIYSLAQREWEHKCDAMIAFMSQKNTPGGKPEYSKEYLNTLLRGWKNCFPSRANVNAMTVTFSSFPITSVKQTIEDEMVRKSIEDIYSIFASSVQEAAREVNEEIENCLRIIVNNGAKNKRSSKAPFTALASKIEKVKSFLYAGDSQVSDYLDQVLSVSEMNLLKVDKGRLDQIEETLMALKEKAKAQSKKAGKVSGHLSAMDISEIPMFD